ncbi:MAG: hypothetical protein K5894_06525 [Lachnospiraceae bacterium]|nr:hypothetical protein [Lachnospiraceae bacterium]
MIKHSIPPVFDKDSRILILGSFPSVKSREVQFFYGHPQNRFWRVIAAVFKEDVPMTIDEKKTFLIKKHIAVPDDMFFVKMIVRNHKGGIKIWQNIV